MKRVNNDVLEENKMRVLVAVTAYPTFDGKKPMSFVHSRCLYYRGMGISVTVLNFGARNSYEIDGIQVICLSDYESSDDTYNVLICHAANLRNHYRFLQKYENRFEKKVFVFHGHEILRNAKYYPRPYAFNRTSRTKRGLRNIYDSFKLLVWRRYYLSNIDTIRLIFVSRWLLEQFLLEIRCDEKMLNGHAVVIPNSVGHYFEVNRYHQNVYQYDFITIRTSMDKSSYCLDIIVQIAKKMPTHKFCVIGNGQFFSYFPKPDNVQWIKGVYSHEELGLMLNTARFALMPTREDSQGLMACEVATLGIPLITSDIDVCKEVFSDCPNVAFISNQSLDIEQAINTLEEKRDHSVWNRYYAQNTVNKEAEYIRNYVRNE